MIERDCNGLLIIVYSLYRLSIIIDA